MSIEMLQMLKRDALYFRATKAMDGEDAKSPVIETRTSVGDRYALEDKDLLGHPIIRHDDNEAFRKLYDDRLEILAILHSALRGGKERYKRALHEIMEICQRVE